jgi:hypothetical protein
LRRLLACRASGSTTNRKKYTCISRSRRRRSRRSC